MPVIKKTRHQVDWFSNIPIIPLICILVDWFSLSCRCTAFLKVDIPPTWDFPDNLVFISVARTAAGFSIATAITSGHLPLYFLTIFLNISDTVFSMWASGLLTGQLERAAWAALFSASNSFPLSSHRHLVVILIFPFKVFSTELSKLWGRHTSML